MFPSRSSGVEEEEEEDAKEEKKEASRIGIQREPTIKSFELFCGKLRSR